MASTRVTTKKVRFSYVHVFEPTSMEEGGTKKYSAAILIPKSDKATVAAIQEAIKLALEEGKSKHFGGATPKKWSNPLYDGDEEYPDDEVYADHYFVRAKSIRRPVILGQDKELLVDKDDFYSGCYGRAVINFYAYGSGLPSKGVAVGLESAMKLEDGENLGGGGLSQADILAAYDDDDDDML
jgi:hypothetical protein